MQGALGLHFSCGFAIVKEGGVTGEYSRLECAMHHMQTRNTRRSAELVTKTSNCTREATKVRQAGCIWLVNVTV
jgi:hypothetical protein